MNNNLSKRENKRKAKLLKSGSQKSLTRRERGGKSPSERPNPSKIRKTEAAHIIKGKKNENRVAGFLKTKGFHIIFQNKKVLGVEIDLLAEKNGRGLLVEVKTLKTENYLQKILSKRQKKRLCLAAEALGRFPKGVDLQLAVVENKSISFFPIV